MMEKSVKFVALYPSRPFWAVTKIDLEAHDLREHFREKMSEFVFHKEKFGHTVTVSRDGRISLNIADLTRAETGKTDNLISSWGIYLDHLNAIYLFLDCAVAKVQNFGYFNLHEVTNRDAFPTSVGELQGESIASESIAGSFQMARSYDWHPTHSFPMAYQPMFFSRHLVSAEALSEMTEKYFNAVMVPGAVKAYAGIARAISSYKITNYETSLVFSWFIIEELLNMAWEEFLVQKSAEMPDKGQRINKDRRNLLNGRDYTTSVRSNILELAGSLDFSLFLDINTVRGHRNKIVHQSKGFTVDDNDARLGVSTSLKMAEKRWGISIMPSMGYSITGL